MSNTKPALSVKDLQGKTPIWCAGCGDFGVLRGMQTAAINLGLQPENTVLVTGIGCSGNITAYFRTYGFHGIHGRALPEAIGVKLANPELTVLVAGGDGDGFGIGLGHFLHACRRNADITYIVMDNQVYGLTKGQTSPTTPQTMSTKASPLGPLADPVNPLELALAGGATYVAQAFSGDMKNMVKLIEDGVRHPGFAIINIQSPCVTYNHQNTYAWYRENTANLADSHDPSDLEAAHRVARDRSRVPVGLLYKAERPTLGHALRAVGPADEGAPNPVATAANPAAALSASSQRFEDWIDAFRVR